MKKLMMVVLAALTTGSVLAESLSDDERAWPSCPIGFGLAAPLQVPYVDSDVSVFRFGGLFGLNAAVRGFDLGLVERSSTFKGLQVTGFGWTSGLAKGCLLGALANVAGGNVTAFELGLANVTWGDFEGFQLGAVNYGGAFGGVQLGALVNWNGLSSRGLQVGVINADQVKFGGVAIGALNYGYEVTGLQLGAFNLVDAMNGVQIGVINACDTLTGLQLGLINMVATSTLPMMVIANASF